MIKIYTDGSTRKNGQDNAPGAFGFVVFENDEMIYKEAAGFRPATNQKAELKAVIAACEWASKHYSDFDSIQIISDSAYIINCFRNHWYYKWQINGWMTSKNGQVQNVDLWKKLIPYFESANFDFVKIKGHAGVVGNCIVDEMVQEITQSML